MKASVANEDMVVSAANDGSLMAEMDTEAWMAAYQEQEAALVDLTCFVAALQVIMSFKRILQTLHDSTCLCVKYFFEYLTHIGNLFVLLEKHRTALNVEILPSASEVCFISTSRWKTTIYFAISPLV